MLCTKEIGEAAERKCVFSVNQTAFAPFSAAVRASSTEEMPLTMMFKSFEMFYLRYLIIANLKLQVVQGSGESFKTRSGIENLFLRSVLRYF